MGTSACSSRCIRCRDAPGWFLPVGAPRLGLREIPSDTQADWLQEERNRHPKDSEGFQMGNFILGWG